MGWGRAEGEQGQWRMVKTDSGDLWMYLSKKHRAYKITTGINDTDTFWETQAVKT